MIEFFEIKPDTAADFLSFFDNCAFPRTTNGRAATASKATVKSTLKLISPTAESAGNSPRGL